MSLLALFNPKLAIDVVVKNRYLLSQIVRRNIASRYRGSALGLIWSVAQPLAMLGVYTFVFSFIFKVRWGVDTEGRGTVAIILFCGLAVFNIFSESLTICCSVIHINPNYVKKVIFPLEILPLCQVISTVILGMIWFGHLWKVTHHAPSSSSVQVMIECLGHYVCHHFLCRTHVHYDVSLGNMISNVMISNVNVPGFLMICLVLCPGSSGRVVLEQNNWLLACLLELS